MIKKLKEKHCNYFIQIRHNIIITRNMVPSNYFKKCVSCQWNCDKVFPEQLIRTTYLSKLLIHPPLSCRRLYMTNLFLGHAFWFTISFFCFDKIISNNLLVIDY